MADTGMEFVAEVMGVMLNDAHSTSQTLQEMNERTIARLRAELNLIRENMEYLLEQPWTPSSRAIERALYPSAKSVDSAVEAGMGEFGYASH